MYCLLAYLPYTYFFLIKSPPYAWMPWFLRHQAALYWIAVTAAFAAGWNFAEEWKEKRRTSLLNLGWIVAAGCLVTVHPFLRGITSDWTAYAWSLAALAPLVIISLWRSDRRPESGRTEHSSDPHLFPYSAATLAAVVVSVVYLIGARMRVYSQSHTISIHAADLAYSAWSLVSHIALALAVFSLLNIIAFMASRNARPREFRLGANGALILLSLWFVLHGFLESALSFSGALANLYCAALALALTLWGFSLALPFVDGARATRPGVERRVRVGSWILLLASCLFAIAFPFLIGDADWSGFLGSVVTLTLWVVVSICLFRLRPGRVQYSAVTLLGVIAVGALIYEGLLLTEIFWSRPLGSTDDEISLALEAYGGNDGSFLLAHHILGGSRHELCGDLCRILRENTNVRDTAARVDVKLVDSLTPTTATRPNVFVFVIDSMRPDYLGAYNSKVDYTPNLDAFARDSIVLHHAYTQYAGTSLSEPAIWAGAMMLHAHYLQPFSRLNSLDKLMHTDGYRMLVSEDEVLSAIMPDDDVVKLDTDKKLWNQLEIGSTIHQAEAWMDAHRDEAQPIFFYSQPKNVHQFARNDVPSPVSQHWPERPGLNTRITYEVHWVDSCLGQFFDDLKKRGMYDSSIIVVTSDHGDATGEFGRQSHSVAIWPEVMQVPLIIHLPREMRAQMVYDDARLSTLTDITPTLYYLLGHRPIRPNALHGRPLLTETPDELASYAPHDLLLASDVRAVYGILTADGRHLYTTYDSPAQSYLFDLASDPNAQHNILTPAMKQHYDEEIMGDLQAISRFYGYKPGMGSLLASSGH